jgi:hypothetical protein
MTGRVEGGVFLSQNFAHYFADLGSGVPSSYKEEWELESLAVSLKCQHVFP